MDGGQRVVTLGLEGTDDVIVLFDPDVRPEGLLAWHPYPNLVRLSPSGETVWHAELIPGETTAKCWTDARLDGALRAWTYSWTAVIDIDSGKIVESTFTK